MAKFEKEFHKRLRRLGGVTDDSTRVTISEDVEEGHTTCFECFPDDYGTFDYGPSYHVTIYIHPENTVYWDKNAVKLRYEGMAELMRALDEVDIVE